MLANNALAFTDDGGAKSIQYPVASFNMLNINQTQPVTYIGAKTTLGSSRQSIQSSSHLDDRDAIL